MASWRNLFKPWILVRGQEYYECGQVVELKKIGSVVTAEVSGSQAYHVEIHRSGERVTSMFCDCPHAAGGENCKHMAAVLFALDEKSAQPRMDWQTALAQMGESQLRELLHSLAAEDGTLDGESGYVLHSLRMPHHNPHTFFVICKNSYVMESGNVAHHRKL